MFPGHSQGGSSWSVARVFGNSYFSRSVSPKPSLEPFISSTLGRLKYAILLKDLDDGDTEDVHVRRKLNKVL